MKPFVRDLLLTEEDDVLRKEEEAKRPDVKVENSERKLKVKD